MSNEEQERIEAGFTEWWNSKGDMCCGPCASEAYAAGYARGRADAMELPEVRAEELESGEIYLAYREGDDRQCIGQLADDGGFDSLCRAGLNICYDPSMFTSFRGPLPLGGGE